MCSGVAEPAEEGVPGPLPDVLCLGVETWGEDPWLVGVSLYTVSVFPCAPVGVSLSSRARMIAVPQTPSWIFGCLLISSTEVVYMP